jgi:hypothetical protein
MKWNMNQEGKKTHTVKRHKKDNKAFRNNASRGCGQRDGQKGNHIVPP